jgi:hypothetical protein
VKLLVGMHVLLAFISIPPGVALLEDPSGSSLGIPFVLPTLTHAVPFIHDFAPVGIWLVTVYGVLPIVTAVGVWMLKRWACYMSASLGATLATWIGVELVMFSSFGFVIYYPVIGGIGLAILAVSLLPSVRRSLVPLRGVHG